MKRIISLAIAAVAVLGAFAQDAAVQQQIKLKSDSLSETFGTAYGASIAGVYDRQATLSKPEFLRGFQAVMSVDTGNRSYLEGLETAFGFLKTMENMERNQGIKLNRELFTHAFLAQMTTLTPLTGDDLMALNTKLQADVQSTAALVQANDPLVKAGEAFAAQKLASGEGYIKTASGLVYKMIAPGEGDNFKSTDRVRLNYKGTHVDGTVFDQSRDTTTLGVSQVVPGFKEALMLMKPGSKLIAIIPGDLAYGKRGAGNGMIKPNETLVFEIDTYGVETPTTVKAPAGGGKVNSDRRQTGLDPNVKTVAPPRNGKAPKRK